MLLVIRGQFMTAFRTTPCTTRHVVSTIRTKAQIGSMLPTLNSLHANKSDDPERQRHQAVQDHHPAWRAPEDDREETDHQNKAYYVVPCSHACGSISRRIQPARCSRRRRPARWEGSPCSECSRLMDHRDRGWCSVEPPVCVKFFRDDRVVGDVIWGSIREEQCLPSRIMG